MIPANSELEYNRTHSHNQELRSQAPRRKQQEAQIKSKQPTIIQGQSKVDADKNDKD